MPETPAVGLILSLAFGGICFPLGCNRAPDEGKPSAKIIDGWNYFRQGDYVAATTAFNAVLASVDGSTAGDIDAASAIKHRLDAMYGLAQTWDLGSREIDPTKGAALYHQIVQMAPTSDQAAWSMLALARMQHVVPVGQEPDLPAVRKSYQDVIEQFPNHPAAQEAFIYQQSTFVSTLDPKFAQQSLPLLTSFVRDHPDSKFVSPAWRLIGVCQNLLGNAPAALAADIKSVDTHEVDPTNPFVDNAIPYWYLATEAEFRAGDFETARKYYGKLIAEYPSDQKVFPAKQALRRMDHLEQSIIAQMRNAPAEKVPG